MSKRATDRIAIAEPDKLVEALEQSLCEKSLADYIRLAWPIVEPDTPYLSNWHIDAIAEYLTACTRGQIRRLAINIPPRYGKSTLVAVMWPTWMWGPSGRPGERWIFASYAQELATRDSTRRRALMEHPWYRRHWGRLVAFSRDQNEKTRYQNTRRGEMFATSMSGAAMGFGGNWIVIDDPHNAQQASSRRERESAIEFFSQTLSRRLDDKRKGVIVVIMQRLAADDLTGFVLGLGGWEHLKIPGEAHGTERIWLPVSQKYHEREDGELLWPEREGPEQIEEAKLMLGARGYAGQYDQEPVPLGGAVFHSEWWRYYTDATLPRMSRVVFSFDGANKQGRENDYSVFTVWGVGEDRRCYLLYVWRRKAELPELKRWMAALIVYWRAAALRWNATLSAILIEDASSGVSLIQEFKEPIRIDDQTKTILKEQLRYEGGYPEELHPQVCPPILPIKVDRDKLARAEAVTPMIERGDVLLPDPASQCAPWLGEYLRELSLFTGAQDEHDDQVDATTQFLNYVRGLGSFDLANFWRRQAEQSQGLLQRRCLNCGREVAPQEEYRRSGWNVLHVKCPG